MCIYYLPSQNHEVQGQNLLIKFPDNPIANGLPLTKLVKTSPTSQPTQKHEKQPYSREKNSTSSAAARSVRSVTFNHILCYHCTVSLRNNIQGCICTHVTIGHDHAAMSVGPSSLLSCDWFACLPLLFCSCMI